MFEWLSTIFGSAKKTPKTPSPPKSTEPKLVTIFNSVTILSPDGETNSLINADETKPRQRKRNPKSWSKESRVKNQKSIVRESERLRITNANTLGSHTSKPLTKLVSTKKVSNSNGNKSIKSILKRKSSNGGNKTRKL